MATHGAGRISTAATLQRMRDVEGEHVAVLYLVANDERFIHLLITPDGPVVKRSELDPKEVNHHVTALRQALRPDLVAPQGMGEDLAARQALRAHSEAQLLHYSQWLYDRLMRPVAKAIADSGAESLVLFVDGPLRYLPLGVLHDGEQYLVEQYNLARLVGRVEDALLKQNPGNSFPLPNAAFGTAQFNVEFKAGDLTFPPLASVAGEIAAVAGAEGTPYFNEHFTPENLFEESELGLHSVLHIATHYAQRPGPLDNSFWVFGSPEGQPPQTLSAGALLMAWHPQNVELLTLSACSTAPFIIMGQWR